MNTRVVIASAISRRTITTESGKPFPMPFAMTTMSGTMSCSMKPKKCAPVRPTPVCTSSAITTPPISRVISAAARTYSDGSGMTPP